MADQKLLEKLNKLRAHAESAKEIGNEAEALAFATMLQNLLAKHQLDMTDLEYERKVIEEPVGQFMAGGGFTFGNNGKKVYKNYPTLEVQSRRIHWQEELASVIARAHSCRIMVSSGTAVVWFVGRPSTVKAVDYLYLWMVDNAEKLAHKAYMQMRRQMRKEGGDDKDLVARLLEETHGFKASFLQGFIQRLAQRLYEEKRSWENAHNTGVALMRINKEEQDVKDYVESLNSGVAKGIRGQATKGNMLGYQQGKATADQLDIHAKKSEKLTS